MRSGQGFPGDVGTPMLIKPQTGNGNGNPAPDRMGNSFWLLDWYSSMGVRDEIANGCFNAKVGDPVPDRSGSVTGPTRQGVQDLCGEGSWGNLEPVDQGGRGLQLPGLDPESPGDHHRARRPELLDYDGKNTKPDPNTKFSNFARMFILNADNNNNIQAVFLGTAPGGAGGPVGGSLVKVLQLIQ